MHKPLVVMAFCIFLLLLLHLPLKANAAHNLKYKLPIFAYLFDCCKSSLYFFSKPYLCTFKRVGRVFSFSAQKHQTL